jgi:hypothetical protein
MFGFLAKFCIFIHYFLVNRMKLAFELQEIANEAKELNRVLFALQDLRIEQTLDLKIFMLELREDEMSGILEDIDLADAYLQILNNSLAELTSEVFKNFELLNAKIDLIDNF